MVVSTIWRRLQRAKQLSHVFKHAAVRVVILISFCADNNNEQDYNVKGCEMDQIQEIASKLRPPEPAGVLLRAQEARRGRAHIAAVVCGARARLYNTNAHAAAPLR